MDRIDIWLHVPQVEHRLLAHTLGNTASLIQDSSSAIQERVMRAHAAQIERFSHTPLYVNSEMGVKEIKKFCVLSPAANIMFERAAKQLNLSARAYHRVLKVSRTIADLAGSPNIEEPHMLEAIQYRPTKLI